MAVWSPLCLGADGTERMSIQAELDRRPRKSRQASHPYGDVVLRYGVALLGVILAYALRRLFDPALQDFASHLFFVAAVLLASAVGGLFPGLLATLLSAVLAGNFGPDIPP